MRELIKQLSGRQELLVVERRVDPRYELAPVTKRVQQSGKQAVLFTKVRGTPPQVVRHL